MTDELTQGAKPPAPTATRRALEAPMTSEEMDWWRRERPKVLLRKFGLKFLTFGGFTAVAGFTRPMILRPERFDLSAALWSAMIGAGVAVVIALVLVMSEGGDEERDKRLRERRLRDAMLE